MMSIIPWSVFGGAPHYALITVADRDRGVREWWLLRRPRRGIGGRVYAAERPHRTARSGPRPRSVRRRRTGRD